MPLSKEEVDKLNAALKEPRNKPDDRLGMSELIERLKRVRAVVKELSLGADGPASSGDVAPAVAAGTDGGDESVDFAGFFQSMGQSLVDTQRLLDAESEEYLRSVRDKPHLGGSVFRLPKLSGELQVGLTETKQKGINLLLFANKVEAERFQQHKIQFEMTAAPAPLEALQALEALRDEATDVALMLAPAERKAVFEDVSTCLATTSRLVKPKKTAQLDTPAVARAAFGEARERVLIVPVDERAPLLVQLSSDNATLTLWELTRAVPAAGDTAAADPKLELLWSAPRKPGRTHPGTRGLFGALADVVHRQVELLSRFG
ncbi:MAG: hypothetical protein AAF682_14555 [Planctomycetota bacterium]